MAGDTVLGAADRADWGRRAIMAAGVVGMWEWDHRRDTARYCPVAAGLLAGDPGLAWHELTSDRVLAGLHPDDASPLRAQMQNGSSNLEIKEHQIRVGPGDVRRLLCSGRACRDADGELLRSMGTVIDVTGVEASGYGAALEDRDELDDAARHGMAAYRSIQTARLVRLIEPARALLVAIGQEIARRVKRKNDVLH